MYRIFSENCDTLEAKERPHFTMKISYPCRAASMMMMMRACENARKQASNRDRKE